VEDQLRLLAHASRWLAEQDLDASGMTPRRADLFRVARRSEGYVRSGSARALSPLLGYLRGLGIVPESAAAAVATPAEVLLAEYRDYLVCAGTGGRLGAPLRTLCLPKTSSTLLRMGAKHHEPCQREHRPCIARSLRDDDLSCCYDWHTSV
jgi:hypothetical protein